MSQEVSMENVDNSEKKLADYSALLHAVIYDWNYPSDISNQDIKKHIKRSGIQQDDSKISVVFRHLMALSTTGENKLEKVPIFVKEPLLKKNWNALKLLSLEGYAYAKAYHIYITALINHEASQTRTISTIFALQNLKREMLKTGNEHAVATVSMWLAMEYSQSSPLNSINEIEYALPHLPIKSRANPLETELDKLTALAWLSKTYEEINFPNRALQYGKSLIKLKIQHNIITAWDYVYPITAANRMDQYDVSLELLEEARKVTSSEDAVQYLILLSLELITWNLISDDKTSAKVKETAMAIKAMEIDQLPPQISDMKEFTNAIYMAYFGSDEEFSHAVSLYKNAVAEKIKKLAFPRDSKLTMLSSLKNIYRVRNNLEMVDHYRQLLDEAQLEVNITRYQLQDSFSAMSLSKDVELETLRQKELEKLRQERLGLYDKNEQMQATIYILVIILVVLSSWLWYLRTKRVNNELLADSRTC